jgi:hypothetical protein
MAAPRQAHDLAESQTDGYWVAGSYGPALSSRLSVVQFRSGSPADSGSTPKLAVDLKLLAPLLARRFTTTSNAKTISSLLVVQKLEFE